MENFPISHEINCPRRSLFAPRAMRGDEIMKYQRSEMSYGKSCHFVRTVSRRSRYSLGRGPIPPLLSLEALLASLSWEIRGLSSCDDKLVTKMLMHLTKRRPSTAVHSPNEMGRKQAADPIRSALYRSVSWRNRGRTMINTNNKYHSIKSIFSRNRIGITDQRVLTRSLGNV